MSSNWPRIETGIPLFCLAVLPPSSNNYDTSNSDDHNNGRHRNSSVLFAAGGGGSSKSGVKNKIVWFSEREDQWQQAGELVVSDNNTGAVMCMATDGKVLACGLDNYCQLYNIHTTTADKGHYRLEQAQRFLADFKQTTGPYDESYLRVVRLSDSLLATGGTDGVPRIWSIDGSRKLHELSKLHQGEITDMAFHENELMISASQDLVAVFNAKDGQVLHRLQAAEFAGLNRSYRSLIIPVAEELGDVLATVLDKRSRQTFIQVLEPQANYRPSSLGGRKISQAPVSAIMGSHHGVIVYGTSAGDVGFVDEKRLRLIRLNRAVHGLPITAIAADRRSGDVFTASADGSITVILRGQQPVIRQHPSGWIFIICQVLMILLAVWIYHRRKDYLL